MSCNVCIVSELRPEFWWQQCSRADKSRVGHKLEDGVQQEEGGHHDGVILIEFERPEAHDIIHSQSGPQ